MRFSIRESLRTISSWFRTNWNREHFKVVWEALSGFPWDYYYYTRLEIAKLEEMIAYHKKSRIVVESERNYMVFWLTMAKRMLEIMSSPNDLVEYEGKIKFDPVTIDDEELKGEYFELNGEDLKRNLKVYVNTKNVDRFAANEAERDFLLRFPEELYARKAKALYAGIWKMHLETWWD